MEQKPTPSEEPAFEDIVKKTKTGITFPKELRDTFFPDEEKEVYFKLTVPKEKNKIILEFLTEEQVAQYSSQQKPKKPKAPKVPKIPGEPQPSKPKKQSALEPNFGDYFIYSFEAKDKIQPILESIFYKFTETPVNFEDIMGRIKYVLVNFLSATKTENARLYFAVEKFLLDIIEKFNQPNLIDWIFEKIIPNIESKFLYELGLLSLVEIGLKTKRYEKAETYIFYVLKNIDDYPKSEVYNIMNSFKQLVKTIKKFERSPRIDTLLKEKLMEYGAGVQDVDHKIQIVEFLEELNYIELGYNLAKEIELNLAPDSIRVEDVRKLVGRLYQAPITETKL